MSKKWKTCFLFITLSLILAACAGAPDSAPSNGSSNTANVALQGAGATFPYPLYSKWFSEYNKKYPQVKIDYQSIGSGGGIKQVTERTVDFGASDTPMTDEQLKAASQPLVHIPTVLGAVVATYNLPSLKSELKLTPELLVGIFLGEIKKWNDAKIASVNKDLQLPDKDIAVVHRSDGSGTTAIFVDYLSKVSEIWKEKVGKGTSVNWPVGLGGKGNEGVTGQVKQVEGAIGYVELIYALQNKLPYASLQNQAGKFVKPSLESVTAAAAATVEQLPDDLRVSITDATGDEAYSIASATYLLVYQDMDNQLKAQTLSKFLWWAIHDGQQQAKDLGYAPLPDKLVKKVEAKIKGLTSKGASALVL